MRRAKRTCADQAYSRLEDARHAVDLCGFERLLESQLRQYRGNPLDEHGLPRPRRPDHQDVVSAGAGDLEGALGGRLAAHILEVREGALRLSEESGLSAFSFFNTVDAAVAWLRPSTRR